MNGKKENTTTTTIETQRTKNLRTNCAILKRILDLPIEDSTTLCVIGMDWVGYAGCSYTIRQSADIFVANYGSDLFLPTTLSTLTLLKDTLDHLFEIKNHHVNLANIVTPAREKQNIQEQLDRLRPAAKTRPVVFFYSNQETKEK